MSADSIEIRPLREGDREDWERLWTGYLEFYESSVSREVYDNTFARLIDPAVDAMGCFVAEIDGRLAGLVHYIQHPHNWRIEDVIYLQDLFTDPSARGRGVGRALIEAVYAEADRRGCPSVYWLTQDFNHTARILYDRIASLTPFVKYQR